MEDDIINKNLNGNEETFYYSLTENGEFCEKQFKDLMDYIFNLNTTVKESERLKKL